MRYSLVAVSLLSIGPATSDPSTESHCVSIAIEAELRAAQAVFTGRVTSRERTYRVTQGSKRSHADTAVVEWAAQVAVDRVWKGRVPSIARVVTMEGMELGGDYELETD